MLPTERFIIGNHRSDISAFAETFETWCTDRQIPDAAVLAFQVAFDELLTNAIDYGMAGSAEPEMEVRLTLGKAGLEAELIDNGVPFDPLDRGEPDLESDIESRQIGGLGIHLVRNLMDELRYERSANHNHIFISKRF